MPTKRFQCGNCGHIIEVPQGVPKPTNCPRCGAPAFMIHRLEPGPPGERRGRGGPRKVVLASGTLDLLHLGHVKYLEEAKKAGGRNAKLVVIVARDETVRKRKGVKPVILEEHRRALVESLKVVDEAILDHEEFDIGAVIEDIKPHVIAVGYDQNGIEEQVRRIVAQKKLSVQIMKIGKFGKDELDSSIKIKRKITQLYKI